MSNCFLKKYLFLYVYVYVCVVLCCDASLISVAAYDHAIIKYFADHQRARFLSRGFTTREREREKREREEREKRRREKRREERRDRVESSHSGSTKRIGGRVALGQINLLHHQMGLLLTPQSQTNKQTNTTTPRVVCRGTWHRP